MAKIEVKVIERTKNKCYQQNITWLQFIKYEVIGKEIKQSNIKIGAFSSDVRINKKEALLFIVQYLINYNKEHPKEYLVFDPNNYKVTRRDYDNAYYQIKTQS